MCAISSLQLASCRPALVQNVFRFNTPLYIKWPPALPPVMLPALSRQSRVSGWPSQSHSGPGTKFETKKDNCACARKTTRQFPSVTSSRTSLWLLLRTWLLSAWLLLWLWGIHYVCCCQPHDFKHLWIALLYLLIHSRERGITLRHRKVWCPYTSSQVMQVVAINMFHIGWMRNGILITLCYSKGMQTAYFSYLPVKHTCILGKIVAWSLTELSGGFRNSERRVQPLARKAHPQIFGLHAHFRSRWRISRSNSRPSRMSGDQ